MCFEGKGGYPAVYARGLLRFLADISNHFLFVMMVTLYTFKYKMWARGKKKKMMVNILINIKSYA